MVLENRHPIDWQLLHKSISFYKNRGYIYKEVPWMVEMNTVLGTCPSKDFVMEVRDTALIGSAEQGFMELDSKGLLGQGQFVACSPCFRDDVPDDLHFKTFMKVELYQNTIVNRKSLHKMITMALENFYQLTPNNLRDDLEVITVGEGLYDIVLNDIELGSYGIRSWSNIEWIYGTGIAEPRFSHVINKFKEELI